MARARPVADWLADPHTPADAAANGSSCARSASSRAASSALPDNGSYRRYAELERPYVVWNVVAAAEFSLKRSESCFPVAGCVTYRGFFARDDAERHAAKAREQGLDDVYVYGVPAYSTLGWFDDPLLSTFIRYRDAELARLVFHELAHQLVYARDDTTFNESFAVAVEQEGVRRWLAADRARGRARGVPRKRRSASASSPRCVAADARAARRGSTQCACRPRRCASASAPSSQRLAADPV